MIRKALLRRLEEFCFLPEILALITKFSFKLADARAQRRLARRLVIEGRTQIRDFAIVLGGRRPPFVLTLLR